VPESATSSHLRFSLLATVSELLFVSASNLARLPQGHVPNNHQFIWHSTFDERGKLSNVTFIFTIEHPIILNYWQNNFQLKTKGKEARGRSVYSYTTVA
jgi:hypothetical protein